MIKFNRYLSNEDLRGKFHNKLNDVIFKSMSNKENLEKYKEKRQLKLQETMEIMNLTLEIKMDEL